MAERRAARRGWMTAQPVARPSARTRRILRGIGMAGLLFIVHVTVWREARNLLARDVAYPLVVAIDTDRSAGFTLDAESFDRTITAVRADAEPGTAEVYRAPANMDYLLAAIVLIAAFPRRLYWWYLWLAHLTVGVVALGAFAVGVGWSDAGFAVGLFLRVYVLRALSLLALLVAFAPMWAVRLLAPNNPVSSGGNSAEAYRGEGGQQEK